MNSNAGVCDFREGDTCQLATALVGIEGIVAACGDDACEVCDTVEPPRDRNRVTCSLAITARHNAGYREHPEDLRATATKPPEGVGTELGKVLDWFKIQKCSKCTLWEHKLNVWGPAECRVRIDEIVNHLEAAAADRQLAVPFVRSAAKSLVLMCCRKVERRCESAKSGLS